MWPFAKEDTSVADNRQQSDQHNGTAGTQARRAENQPPQRAAEAAEQAGRGAGGAIHQGGEAAAEIVEEAGQVLAEAERRLVDEVADLVEDVGRQIAWAAEETAEQVRELTFPPAAAGRGLRELSHAVGEFADDLVRTNLRVTEDLVRFANPAPIIRLQRRFARGYLQALSKGGAAVLRATYYAAEETLRPLEERLEQRGHRRQRYTHVADVMSRNVRIASPEDTVQQAAHPMDEQETGVLPIGEGDRLVGTVTDRDLAIRLAAQGKDPARTKVREVMTPDVKWVFDDADLEHAAKYMAEQQVRRLAVLNRQKRLVGILSLGDLAREDGAGQRATTRALYGVSREGGRHTQRVSPGTR